MIRFERRAFSQCMTILAFAGVLALPVTARAGFSVIPFPFFTPIAECGKIGFVPSSISEGELCKVWFSRSGSPFLVAGIESFNEGDEVFVDGLICNVCLTTCFAGAIFNATVTAGCSQASAGIADVRLDTLTIEQDLFDATGGQDFLLTEVQFGIQDDRLVITQAGLEFDEPTALAPGAIKFSTQGVIVDGSQVEGVGGSPQTLELVDESTQSRATSERPVRRDRLVAEDVSDASELIGPGHTGARGRPPFDCSTCVESFCGGTLFCHLVSCDTFCNYACTWVVCDSGEIDPPVGP